jgi:heme oxygenase
MTMALATICDTNKYVRWCLLNGMVTEKGNVKTNAQTVYAYMIDDINYVEEHHALADCEIEREIYFKARKRKQKHHKHFATPMFNCPEWKQVQSRK